MTNKHIIVIDDDQASREGFIDYLTHVGEFEVSAFSNGETALTHLAKSKQLPIAVLLDYVLTPPISGKQVLTILQKKYPRLPVIVFTGRDPTGGVQALEKGAYRYLRRPINMVEVVNILRNLAEQDMLFYKMVYDVRNLLNFDMCLAWQLNKQARCFQIVAWDGAKELDETYRHTIFLDIDDPLIQAFLNRKEPLYMADVTHPKNSGRYFHQKEAKKQGWTSLISVPLVHHNQTIGLIDCYSFSPFKFSSKNHKELTISFLRSFANQAAEAIRNATLSTELEALHGINQILAGTFEEKTVLRQILSKGLELVGTDMGWLYLVDINTGKLALKDSLGIPTNLVEAERTMGEGITGWVAQVGQALNIPDTAIEKRHYPTPTLKIKSEVAVPLRREEETIGVLTAKSRFTNGFSDDDVDLLMALAAQAAIVIGRTKLTKHLQTISSLALAGKIDALADYVVEAARDLTGANVNLWMIFEEKENNQSKHYLKPIASKGTFTLNYKQKNEKVPLDIKQSITALALHKKTPIVRNDIGNDTKPHFYNLTAALEQGWHSFLTAPLIGRGESLGAINLYSQEIGKFGLPEIELMRTFANHVANVILGTRLYEQAQQQATELEALHQNTLRIIAQTKLKAVLNSIVEAAVALLKAKGGKVYLRVTGHEQLELLAVKNIDSKILKPGDGLSFNEGMAGETIRTKKPLIVDNYATYPNRVERLVPLFTAVIEVPLLLEKQAIGVIAVFDDVEKRQFSNDDIPILKRLAQQAALAIDKARLLDQERTLRQQAETLHEVSSAISANLKLEKVGGTILDELYKMVKYCKASIQLIRGDNRTLAAHRGFNKNQIDDWLLRPISHDRLISRIIATKKPLILKNVPDDEPEWDVREHTANIKSWIGIPILYGTETIGFLTLDHDEPGYYGNVNEEMLSLLASQASIAIKNASLFNNAQRRIEDMEIINTVVEIISHKLNTDDLLNEVVNQVVNILRCHHCTIFLAEFKQDKTMLIPKVTNGTASTRILKRSFKTGEGIVGWVFENQQSLIVPDVRKDKRFAPPTSNKNQYRSMLAAPIQAGDQTIGVICANHNQTNWFSKNDQQLVDALAKHIGIAIDRATSLAVLQDISQGIINAQNVDEILQLIVKGAIKMTHTNSGRIYLLNDSRTAIVKSFRHPLDAPHPWSRLEKKQGLTYQVVTSGETIAIPNIQEDDRINPKLDKQIKSTISIPLKLEQRVVGVLHLNDYTFHEFTETEISLLHTLASQAAIALQKTRLFAESQNRLYLLEALHETSLAIVQQLNLQDLLQTILKKIVTLVASNEQKGIGAAYWQCNHDTNTAIIQYSTNPRFIGVKIGFNESLIGEVVKTKKVAYVNNYPNWANRANIFDKTKTTHFIKNLIEAPVIEKDNVIAILAVTDASGKRRFTDTDIELLERFSNLVVIAIRNAHHLEQEKSSRKQAETLHHLSNAISSGVNVEKYLALTVKEAVELTQSDSGIIYLIDPSKQSIVHSYVYPPKISHPSSRFNEKIGLTWTIYQQGQMIEIADITHNDDVSPSMKATLIKSLFGIPLKLNNVVIGVLFLNKHSPYTFTNNEKIMLNILAEQAALGIDRAQRYEQRAEDISVLEEINEAILQKELNEVTDLIVAKAMALTNASYCVLRLVDKYGLNLEQMAVKGRDSKMEIIPIDDTTLNGRVARTGEAYLVPNVKQNPHYNHWYADTQSCMCVPLKRKNQTIGTLYVESTQLNAYSENYQLNLLQSLANQASIAIDNARLYQERIRDINALRDINEAVISKTSAEILKLVLEKTLEVMPGEHSTLWLLEKETGDLVLREIVGSIKLSHLKQNRLKASKASISKLVAKTGKLYICDNVDEEPNFYRIYATAKSSISVPLKYQGSVIGVLNVESSHLSAFTPQHGLLLSSFADQAAIAIENTRLLEREVKRGQQLKALQEIGVTITSQLGMEDLLGSIAENVNAITNADFSTLFPYNTDSQQFEQGIRQGKIDVLPSIPSQSSFAFEIAQTKKPIYIEDINQKPTVDPIFFKQKNVKSFAGIPLLFGDKTVGVLYINYSNYHHFSAEEQETIMILANQAAVAIENANLYTKMERKVEERTKAWQEAQAKVADAEKSMAIGKIGAQFAHRSKNLVGPIRTRIQMAKEHLNSNSPKDKKIIRQLDKIDSELESLFQLAEKIKHPQTETIDKLAVNNLLEEAQQDVWNLHPNAEAYITVKKLFTSNLPLIEIEKDIFKDTLINLITNAVEAMPQTGILTLSTKKILLKNQEQGIKIIVTDNGIGISKNNISKIFDLAYTTKKYGTGLGLYQSKSFIHQWGGEITVESTKGQGSTFTVILPIKPNFLSQTKGETNDKSRK